MNVEVIINGNLAYATVTDLGDMSIDATRAENQFNAQLLRRCGVEVQVQITGVQSKMNEPGFIERG
jgi:hypothetical protein